MSQETPTLKENSPVQQQLDQDTINSMNVFNFLLKKLNGTIRSSPESLSLDEKILPSSLIYPVYNQNIDYCHEFWQLYLENELIVAQMKDQVLQSKEVQARIHKLERKNHPHHHKNEHNNDHHHNHNPDTGDHVKKKRRAANEIEKIYSCPYKDCDRAYGSDVSLNLHIKIKHNGGSKTERERLVKMILEAKIQHKELPEINLNLPPTFLQDLNIERILKGKDHNKENHDSNIENGIGGNLSEMEISNILKELNRAVDLHHLEGGDYNNPDPDQKN